MATKMGWRPGEIELVDNAARYHDVGKYAMPDLVLMKPSGLNEQETILVRTHATLGGDLLAKLMPDIKIAEDIARYHHEWYDGSGYPDGKAGEDIPECARMFALVDVFDSMGHDRRYRPAIPQHEVLATIVSLRGRQFDPRLTDMFVDLIHELTALHPDLDGFLASGAADSPFLKARHKIWHTLRSYSTNVKEPAGLGAPTSS
jgi:putative two-component system response regulator